MSKPGDLHRHHPWFDEDLQLNHNGIWTKKTPPENLGGKRGSVAGRGRRASVAARKIGRERPKVGTGGGNAKGTGRGNGIIEGSGNGSSEGSGNGTSEGSGTESGGRGGTGSFAAERNENGTGRRKRDAVDLDDASGRSFTAGGSRGTDN